MSAGISSYSKVTPWVCIVPVDGFHFHQVNNAGETFFSTNCPLQRNRVRAQTGFDLTNNFQEVSAHAVHFVNERDARNFIFVCLTPYGFQTAAEHHQLRSKTITAPSRTRMERSTSIVKSTCPGVSMMFTRCGSYCLAIPDQNAVVAAEVMVIPRSCSCSIQSMVAAPS